MPGGKRNPLSMSQMLETLGDVVQSTKTRTGYHKKQDSLPSSTSFVDLVIQFIGASGLPKMDVVGTADPYFVAKIDKRISFVSKVIRNELAPVWNETWRVHNVPTTAILHITVMDKDEGAVTDDYIGAFDTSVSAGAKEAEIVGPMFRRDRGTFWLKIDSTPTQNIPKAFEFPYLFDGPIRYSRHFSPTVGILTNLDEARLYSTWKMYLRGVPVFFGDRCQSWNRKHKPAQKIFQGPTSVAVRSGIQAGHRMLYARTAANGFGMIEKSTDVLEILHGGVSRPGSKNANIQMQHMKRVKPAIYTYIISSDDDSFRFSETGAAFFVDFASKHALHSNCSEMVRYSGEFHPRPQGGWQNFSDDIPDEAVEWELVIDNNSGTYAPDKMVLPDLKELLEYNFPGFTIYAWDREDPRLKESVEACRDYAVNHRGVGKDELQPTANAGEVTLMHQVSMSSHKPGNQSQNTGDGDQAWDENGGETQQETNTSGDPSEHVLYSYDQQRATQHHGHDTHSSRYDSSSFGADSRDQAPPLPPRPLVNPFPRTSSEFITNNAPTDGVVVGSPFTFPEPTKYVPPSQQGQFVPIDNPKYGGYGSSVPPPISSSQYQNTFSPPPPPLPNTGQRSRPTSGDHSILPPGCAPPATFPSGGMPPPGSRPFGQGQGIYDAAMMSRYDSSRR